MVMKHSFHQCGTAQRFGTSGPVSAFRRRALELTDQVVVERIPLGSRRPNPLRQGGALNTNAMPRYDLPLPVQQRVIGILGDDHGAIRLISPAITTRTCRLQSRTAYLKSDWHRALSAYLDESSRAKTNEEHDSPRIMRRGRSNTSILTCFPRPVPNVVTRLEQHGRARARSSTYRRRHAEPPHCARAARWHRHERQLQPMKLIEALEGLEMKEGDDFPRGDKAPLPNSCR